MTFSEYFTKSTLVIAAFCTVSNPAFSRPLSKDHGRNHPNYEKYATDDQHSEGRSYRLAGIITTIVGPSVGGIMLLAAIFARNDDSARNYGVGGGILLLGGLGAGIPMIVIGKNKMNAAKERIDLEHPEQEPSANWLIEPERKYYSTENAKKPLQFNLLAMEF